jgi:phosphohistidine phosphatase
MQPKRKPEPAQRRLILVRHAKAAEEDVTGGDHARPLNERGQTDAQALKSWLAAQGVRPDRVLCSSAARTQQTLAQVDGNWPVEFSDKLYLASTGDLLDHIHRTDDAVDELLIVGHNPGIHTLLAFLVGDYRDDNDADRLMLKFPTSAAAILTVPDGWRELGSKAARLEQLYFPH